MSNEKREMTLEEARRESLWVDDAICGLEHAREMLLGELEIAKERIAALERERKILESKYVCKEIGCLDCLNYYAIRQGKEG